jgi:signal transduction histidine kinase
MNPLTSLSGKLILASVLMVVTALAIAGLAFVAVTQDDEREAKLERVAGDAGAIQQDFLILQLRREPVESLIEFVNDAADKYDVRVLMIDFSDKIVADSEGELIGDRLDLEQSLQSGELIAEDSPYVAFEPESGTATGLVIVAPSNTLVPAVRVDVSTSAPVLVKYALVLAIPKETLANAWLETLPTMALAAGIAVPVAIVMTIIISLYITRPLDKLTRAALAMAQGKFDVDTGVHRSDEVGRLAQAFQTMAQRVGDAQTKMRNLVANVSHDMKTPLTSILGFSRALEQDPPADPQELRRMAAIIREEAERLSTRLTDLLYLSEIESGQVVLQSDVVDVAALVGGVAGRISEDAGRRGIELEASLAPAEVVTDGQKLERVVENLLDNARKFTPEGGRITVRSGRENGAAWIEVANTNPGMQEEELPRLFERFYRRDRSRAAGRRRLAGSGLGLPIARDLVALLGGHLTASLVDGLVVFRVHLPDLEAARA